MPLAFALVVLGTVIAQAKEPMSQGSVAVSFQGGVVFPFSDLYIDHRAGFGAIFRIYIYVVDRLSINFGAGFRRFSGREGEFSRGPSNLPTPWVTRGPTLIGLSYSLKSRFTRLFPYVGIDFGQNFSGGGRSRFGLLDFYSAKLSFGLDYRASTNIEIGLGTGLNMGFNSGTKLWYAPVDIRLKFYLF